MFYRTMTFLSIMCFAAVCLAQTPKRVGWNYKRVPITIEVTQDVPVKRCIFERGALCADADFIIPKGGRFRMLQVGVEGSCVVEYQGSRYEPSSCPWVQGFTDSQARIFVIVEVADDAG